MKIANAQVNDVFKDYPLAYRKKIKELRSLVLGIASDLSILGGLEETLKWGQPSYLPKKKNIGTTIRIHWLKSKPEQYAIYFNCQTSLVASFKKKFPGVFSFEGKRAIVFKLQDKIPISELSECIQMALTYHLNVKKK